MTDRTPTSDRACARYWGSDGTLCATHNGRFATQADMRCDRTPTSDPVAAAWDAAPQTEAGRRLFTDNEPGDMLESDGVTWGDVVAIEAEARQQARAAFAAHVAALREALGHVLAIGHADANRHGGLCQCVVHEDARALLAAPPEPASPEASGSGLEELVRRAETGVVMYKLGYKEGLAAARPDGAEADAAEDERDRTAEANWAALRSEDVP